MAEAVAVAFSMAWRDGSVEEGPGAAGRLAGFRREFYGCLDRRADALFEIADAVLGRPGRVEMLAELCLEPECRRGHGAVYDAVNCGSVRFGRLRRALAGLPLPRWPDGRIVLAVDVSNWPRPGAQTSPERMFCHVHPVGKGDAQLVPGWPYSVVAALEPGRSSWVLPLDAARLRPSADATEVTAAQVRDVITRLIEAGQWQDGDPDVLAVFDSGYDLTRLAWLLRDLPVQVAGRLRSTRVMYSRPGKPAGANGRPARHGPRLTLKGTPASWPAPALAGMADTRYGPAAVTAGWHQHQKLCRQDGWARHEGELPVVEGTLIRLEPLEPRPGYRRLDPMWLWTSRPDAAPDEVTAVWQAYLRRFDLEHTFRFFKQVLGWTRPRLRDPAAADRWTWLLIAAYAQLWLARDLAGDLRLPWQRPAPGGRLTPARVRRGFRHLRAALPVPASPPKPARPGPGRPPGSRNTRPATRHPVGKRPQTPRPPAEPASQTG